MLPLRRGLPDTVSLGFPVIILDYGFSEFPADPQVYTIFAENANQKQTGLAQPSSSIFDHLVNRQLI